MDHCSSETGATAESIAFKLAPRALASSLEQRQPGGVWSKSETQTVVGPGRVCLVELKLPVAVDHALLAAAQLGGDDPVAGGDDVGVHARGVEAESIPLLALDL